jgi:MoxR-like ATPase
MHTTKPQEKPDLRQLGITERPPEHLLLAALTLRSEDLATNQAALESLRALVRSELEEELAPFEIEQVAPCRARHRDHLEFARQTGADERAQALTRTSDVFGH